METKQKRYRAGDAGRLLKEMQVMGFAENDVAITLLAALAGFLALWVLLTKWQQARAGAAGGGGAAAAAGVVDGTRLTTTKMPPGSLGWPIIGETFSFLSDVKNHPQGLYGFLAKRYARYPTHKSVKVGEFQRLQETTLWVGFRILHDFVACCALADTDLCGGQTSSA